jgi:sugar phosphate permease
MTVHIQREFWAMSKKSIKKEHYDATPTFFGAIDTSLFLTYGIAQFLTGAIGDAFNKRKVLTITFTIQAILFSFVGFAGTYDFYSLGYFCSVFAMIGLVQSIDFPCLAGAIAAWTTKSSRGCVTGIFATNANLGNILGLQLSVIITESHNNWSLQMYLISIVYFVLAFLIFLFFLSSPSEVGFDM